MPRSAQTGIPPAGPGIRIESLTTPPESPALCVVVLSDGRRVNLARGEAEACGCVAGLAWSEALVAAIEARRHTSEIREEALRRLARREHSRAELEAHLVGRRFETSRIAPVLDELETDGWLDEARFIERRLDDWLRRPAHGRTYLLARLEKEGVDRAEAEAALDTLYLRSDEQAAARRVAQSLATGARATPRRIASALARRGFDEEIVRGIEACREAFDAD
jgi:regulatory protein